MSRNIGIDSAGWLSDKTCDREKPAASESPLPRLVLRSLDLLAVGELGSERATERTSFLSSSMRCLSQYCSKSTICEVSSTTDLYADQRQ